MSAAAAAGTRRLGNLEVHRFGYGAMRLTGNGMRGNSDGAPIDRDVAVGLLHSAFEQGVNHVDTAAFYFSPLRSANELINRALASWHGEVVVVTKVGPARDPSGEWLTMARPDQLRGPVEKNLRQLGRDSQTLTVGSYVPLAAQSLDEPRRADGPGPPDAGFRAATTSTADAGRPGSVGFPDSLRARRGKRQSPRSLWE